ncbi:MAG TPA: hypothetical protein VMW56_23990 [Candidatus Margulisiibacteriota bacterium]|nr:hypothetical protein [Candidatus Margulisiibacteriota bacterium]
MKRMLAVMTVVGLTLLEGCAPKQVPEMPPPPMPQQQMGYPGAPPPQVELPPPGAPSQEPVMDQVAARVIAHYQNSSCETLALERSQPPIGQRAEMRQRALQVLRDDSQLRTQFLARVAAPIANKLFECDLIP